jgi:predicted naringenin-chalcone synthase
MTMTLRPSNTIILDVETANPPQCLTQQEIWEFVSAHVDLSARGQGLYKRFLLDEGITSRYFAWDRLSDILEESVDDKMKRFEHWAVRLAAEAAQKIFQKGHSRPADIDAVFVSTCTGYLCPGLSTYVSQKLGLRPEVYTLDLVGLGCAGALPALRAADDYLHRYPDSDVLVIAVEICSAAVHWDEKPELILSNSIFSDGAAVALLTNRPRTEAKGLRIQKISSVLWPEFRNELRFKYLDSRLCNVISAKVPEIASRAIHALHHNQGMQKARYAFHSGGRKILDAIQTRLELDEGQMEPSRRILKNYGNMSSPSVLFALREVISAGLKPRESVVCFSFGAGFLASVLQGEWQGF